MPKKEVCIVLFLIIVFGLFSANAFAGETPRRIVSLAPNMTEILFAIGLGDRIVGVTSYCDYPEEAKKKPKVGGMSNPSLEAVISLKPDLVVMTTDGNPKEFEERLHSLKMRTYVFRASRLPELPRGVREMGKELGVQEKADAFAREFETALSGFAAGQRTNGVKKQTTKKALFIVWPEPLIVAGPGTVIDDALAVIGAENIASKAHISYPKYSIEEIIRQSPDVIIIGRGMESKDIEKVAVGLLKRLQAVPAARNKKVFYVSDDLYRLGPRTIRGIGEISRLVDW
ncbi:MAG TPA: cobalamin-binding protein [Thermodesulfovibrionales bacterium]|nr:cobalamin-binding protein [Thermodesulfovibrionales bacterium]